MSDFGDLFLARIGDGLTTEARAANGTLPDRLSPFEIASLAFERDTFPFPQDESEGKQRARAFERMAFAIEGECERGTITAHYIESGINRGPIIESLWKQSHGYWYIHRDEARRYFQALDLMPGEGTALWYWLRDRAADESLPIREAQQDQADFQKLCLDRWAVSPTIPITGPAGIVSEVGSSYLRKYARRTLENWARKVAPDDVRNRRGRPPGKISVTPGK